MANSLKQRHSARTTGFEDTPGKMLPAHHASRDATPVPFALGKRDMAVTDFTITIPGSVRSTAASETSQSRWRTKEFMLYYLAFVLVVPIMIWWPIRLSQENHPNYPLYAWRLSDGWLFGWKVDNSDHQYRTFRSGLPSLLLLSGVYLLCSKIHSQVTHPSPQSRSTFIAGISTLLIFVLHGTSAIKVLVILAANYYLSKLPKSGSVARVWPALLIAGNMLVLFFNERNDGYRYAHLYGALESLDKWGGVLPRWHVNFNITMLRIVSFGQDYHWRTAQTTQVEVPQDYRKRVSTRLPEEDYNLVNFLGYCLYPPLYIAGPIITFNDFVWQTRNPPTITRKDQLSYAIRFLFCLLSMETTLHTMYVVAIKDSAAWEGDSPADLSMIGFWNLVIVWLKLLIPWRFFRLWALLDGVDPPENMIRCVANNYSTLGFWRSWHRSYNLWIVRYIYIPLGGAKNVALSTLLVFTFVALWHDLSFKLLAWGWLVSLFILPELVGRALLSSDKYGSRWWYRHLSAVGGVLNILLMMSANLVGFVLGLEGMKHLVAQLMLTPQGWAFMVFAFGCLFIGVQVMFEYREEERRRGVDRRC